MGTRNIGGSGGTSHIGQLVVGLFLLGLAVAPSVADTKPKTGGFKPIPVFAIYPPLKAAASADEQLASGRVADEHFAMVAPASRPWRIAFLFPHLKDPYWVGCAYGVMREAARLGVASDILPAAGYDDLIGQLRRMDQAITARYDAIVISPISQTGNNASIAKAAKLGIPVFELANDSTSDDLTIKVTTSLKGMGSDAMQWVVHDAERRGLSAINVALLPGPADAGWVKGEVAGSRAAAATAAIKVNIVDIKYGDSDLIRQSQLAAQLLIQHGRTLDYILACTGCAPAAILPLRQAGLQGKVRIVAYDLTREIADSIRRGEIVAAVDTRGVSQARLAIDAAVDVLEKRNARVPRAILVKLGLVDRGNFAAYDFDSSIAPKGYAPILSSSPGAAR